MCASNGRGSSRVELSSWPPLGSPGASSLGGWPSAQPKRVPPHCITQGAITAFACSSPLASPGAYSFDMPTRRAIQFESMRARPAGAAGFNAEFSRRALCWPDFRLCRRGPRFVTKFTNPLNSEYQVWFGSHSRLRREVAPHPRSHCSTMTGRLTFVVRIKLYR
jgi:hypothetical protein